MPETKFTPGPWHRGSESGIRCDVRASNGRKVALTWGLSTEDPMRPAYRAECDANAHLIASAPDLYAALEQAIEALETCHACSETCHACSDACVNEAHDIRGCDCRSAYAWDNAHDALRKARGGS